MYDIAYDVETLPNVFTFSASPLATDDMWTYEISERRNDAAALVSALRGRYWRRMIGFNNLNFDWPVCDALVKWFDAGAAGGAQGACDAIMRKVEDIFSNSADRWSHRVKPRDVIVPQVDLYLIHHLDNPTRSTSLKTLQFNMRSGSVEDMPFPPGTYLTPDEIPVLIGYNQHDVRETKRFAGHSAEMIAFRDELGEETLNFNDTKIGKQFFIKALEERSPGICYDAARQPRQTWRSSLPLGDIILPYVRFDEDGPRELLERIKGHTLRTKGHSQLETKGVFKDLSTKIDGFQFDLGTGGIHGSVERRVITATKNWPIVDIDVKSFYPNIAIVNRLYPAHLGELFCDVYSELYHRRVNAQKAKNAVQSDALKLALNGVYGDSNSIYSPFYDPAYTMAITVNGQLLLLMLAEKLMRVPTLEMLQINTDGMTFRVAAPWLDAVKCVMDWWQAGTALTLEEARYARIFIRDVNNYVAEPAEAGGALKLKGAYDYTLTVGKQHAWHKDHSSLVIQRAAVAAMIEDHDPADFVQHHLRDDPWDFLLRAKANAGSRLELTDGTRLPKTVRYYIAEDGAALVKKMPPLKGQTGERTIGIHAEGQAEAVGQRGNYSCSICGERFQTKTVDFGAHNHTAHVWKVKTCNVFNGQTPGIDLRYYIREAEKLVLT